jgi:Flp pilus assembly protein TadD
MLEGGIAMARGRPAEAVTAYAKALEKQPSSEAVMRLALAQQQVGDTEASVRSLTEWLTENPDDNLARGLLGVQYVALQRLEDARSSFMAMAEANPNDAVALNNLATVEARLGNSDSALAYAERAGKLAPKDPAVQDTLGTILLDRGDTQRALRLLRHAADQIPGNAEIGYHYARALAATDNKTEARDVLRKALDSGQRFQGIDKAQDLMRELDREQ